MTRPLRLQGASTDSRLYSRSTASRPTVPTELNQPTRPADGAAASPTEHDAPEAVLTAHDVIGIAHRSRIALERRLRYRCAPGVSVPDVVATALERLWRRLATEQLPFRHPEAVVSWLYYSARFIAHEERRRATRHGLLAAAHRSTGESADAPLDRIADVMPNPEETLTHKEALALLTPLSAADKSLLLTEALGERTTPATTQHRRRLHRVRVRARQLLSCEARPRRAVLA